ncbi:VanW family protein [Pseudonocardia sp.]|uniref:VanW family protein n=1 Tax=Pseudonocardia sp. TaxID=60912 RepID=UPI003D119197
MAERQSASDEQIAQEAGSSAPGDDPVPPNGHAPEGGPAPGSDAEQAAAGAAPGEAAPVNGAVDRTADRTVVDGAAGEVTVAAAGPSTWFQTSEQPTQAMQARNAAGPAGPPPSLPGASRPGALFEPAAEHPTEVMPAVASAVPTAVGVVNPPPPVGGDGDGDAGSGGRRPLIVVAAVVGLLALLYVVDVVLSLGAVPRGVTVAGVAVGGMEYAAAERELRSEIEPRTTRPVPVTVGQVMSEIDPRTAGLRIDWDATLERAGSQPLNPVTRVTSFFSAREVGVVTFSDDVALVGALEQLAPVVDRAPVEGSVAFEGTTATAVDPVPGQQLDVRAAADVLSREWANGLTVALPLTELPPITTPEDVQTAIQKVAAPAVSGPVTILGEKDTSAAVEPATIAAALTFTAEPGKGLVPGLNPEVVEEAVRPKLASTETPGRDATISFATGAPVIVPSQDGRGIDYPATLKDMLQVITGTGPREITAVYAEQPAELTTDELKGLGITGLISEFTTGGFKPDSGINIKRAAEQVNGTIVEPGETFSLNAATLPRNAANGYVEAGVIDDGAPSRGVGGGTSQVATTLYNAAYFAGMVDVEHKEHSFYISRYPAGREATVVAGAIDLRFRNDNPTGVLIQTTWTPSSITVRMYGTKRYEVTSTPGPRTNPTQPQTVTIPKGKPCSPSQGGPGFTITDTRTLREVSSGQTRTETRTVRYNPSPIVVCEQ